MKSSSAYVEQRRSERVKEGDTGNNRAVPKGFWDRVRGLHA